jgi:hypothetical protein
VVRPDQMSLGVLINAVPRDAVDEAVAVCGVREKRSDGKLPAHVITYVRHEALRCIPGSVGRNSEDVLGSDGLPVSERRPGTIACQEKQRSCSGV